MSSETHVNWFKLNLSIKNVRFFMGVSIIWPIPWPLQCLFVIKKYAVVFFYVARSARSRLL